MITLFLIKSHSRFCSVRDVAVISWPDCILKSFIHVTINHWGKVFGYMCCANFAFLMHNESPGEDH